MPLPFLKVGDTVDIIAPGSQKSPARLEKAFALLTEWGLVPRCPNDLFGPDPFYTNTSSKRADFLKQALKAPDSQAVWCLRGGYGATRLLETLPKSPLGREKYFIGFSDITALHLFLHQKWGWKPLHGPTLGQLVEGDITPETVIALKRLLFEGRLSSLPALTPLNEAAEDLDQTLVKAPITGGNASLIQASLGTPWQIETAGKFLFLEDVDEKPYRTLERLEHMRQAGLFQNVKAVFLFDFNFNTPNADTAVQAALYPRAFQQFAQEITVPLFKGEGVGHTATNFPLILGSSMELIKRELSSP